MIVFRRALAALLIVPLAVIVGACVVVTRTADAALDPEFAHGELLSVDAYNFAHEILFPLLVAELLEEQDEWLPDNFEGVELPSSDETQREVLRLLREVFPPEYLQAEVEQILDQMIPYFAGRTDSFELRFSLAERVNVALGHAPGEPSPVERLFRELDLGRVLIDGAIATFQQEVEQAASAAGADSGTVTAQVEALIPDRDEAAEWFTTQVFAIVDGIRPYLLGETEAFTSQISFDDRNELAEALARMLSTDPDELRSEGFVYTERDLNAALGDEESTARRDIDRQLDILREDFVYTEADFLEDVAEDGDTAAVDDARQYAELARGVVSWVGAAVAAVLVLAVGFLGGRRWATRLMWGAAALVIASGLWFVMLGALYGSVGEPELHDALVEATDTWSDQFDASRFRLIDKVEAIADDFFDSIVSRFRLVLLLSTSVLAGSAVWAYYSGPGSEPPDWWLRLRGREVQAS